ncbi:MAG TPA: LysR family transcriptional regulator, partial [Xanthobacteraceae bacterium]|nr:LysR family transcriptional regulator [Xanthobacteraceae bacterium]
MKDSLQPGVSMVRRIVVDGNRTIGFMGEQGRVYATPELCRDIEYTCREALLDHLQAGEDSVGLEIMVRHTAP